MNPINMNIIHDYVISKYVIDFNNEHISIDIYKNSTEKTILFKNVFSHIFCNDMPYSTIFDLEEKTFKEFFKENRELLENEKNVPWPIMYDDLKELENMIRDNHARYFKLNSSYGLNGWILAETVEVIGRRSPSE
ncbi:hypothetical protein, partial [Acinetobacter baumannii]|uniref:hypothetical protein n=1 Tax=Acinetobacter baumannii TaxID=470 RepID=UPI001AEC9CD2